MAYFGPSETDWPIIPKFHGRRSSRWPKREGARESSQRTSLPGFEDKSARNRMVPAGPATRQRETVNEPLTGLKRASTREDEDNWPGQNFSYERADGLAGSSSRRSISAFPAIARGGLRSTGGSDMRDCRHRFGHLAENEIVRRKGAARGGHVPWRNAWRCSISAAQAAGEFRMVGSFFAALEARSPDFTNLRRGASRGGTRVASTWTRALSHECGPFWGPRPLAGRCGKRRFRDGT